MNQEKIIIQYVGQGYSTNKAFAQGPWARRKSKQSYQDIFYEEIDKLSVKTPITRFKLKLRFNSRIETSNNHILEKIFVDCLRYRGVVIDDSNKVLYKVTFQFDSTLPKNTFRFILTPKELVS